MDAGQRAVGASFSINDAVPIHPKVLTASQHAEGAQKATLHRYQRGGGVQQGGARPVTRLHRSNRAPAQVITQQRNIQQQAHG